MGEYNEKERIRSLRYYHTHKNDAGYQEKRAEYRRKLMAKGYPRAWRLKRKVTTLTHYSKGCKPECVSCGFDDVRALSIDHIEGGGSKERRTNPRLIGQSIYLYLKRMGFPDGYQTLCMNCQFIKRVENNEVNSWPRHGSGGKKR